MLISFRQWRYLFVWAFIFLRARMHMFLYATAEDFCFSFCSNYSRGYCVIDYYIDVTASYGSKLLLHIRRCCEKVETQ